MLSTNRTWDIFKIEVSMILDVKQPKEANVNKKKNMLHEELIP